jgi:hypothetical protein
VNVELAFFNKTSESQKRLSPNGMEMALFNVGIQCHKSAISTVVEIAPYTTKGLGAGLLGMDIAPV